MKEIFRAIITTTDKNNNTHTEILDVEMPEIIKRLEEFKVCDPGADRCLNGLQITFLKATL